MNKNVVLLAAKLIGKYGSQLVDNANGNINFIRDGLLEPTYKDREDLLMFSPEDWEDINEIMEHYANNAVK